LKGWWSEHPFFTGLPEKLVRVVIFRYYTGNLFVGKVRYEIKEENKSQYGNIIPVPFFLKEKHRYKEQVIGVKNKCIYCSEGVIDQEEITSHLEPSC
jgi:hypothetical protein